MTPSPPSPIRAVFFDAVGTLIHPDPPAPLAYAAVGRRFGSRLDEAEIAARFVAAFRRQEALDREAGFRTDEARERLRWQAVVAETLIDAVDPEACFEALFAHFARPEAWRCDPDAADTLAALAGSGRILGLASNFDARLRGVVAGLPPLALLRRFVISAEVGWRKPSPRFFEAVRREAAIVPQEILIVGDDPVNDYGGARAAGMSAVLFDPRHRVLEGTAVRVGHLRDLALLGE